MQLEYNDPKNGNEHHKTYTNNNILIIWIELHIITVPKMIDHNKFYLVFFFILHKKTTSL